MKQRSLAQIFDWFDCLEETTVNTEAGRRRWTTESVARDRLLRELLEMAMNELSFTPPFSQEKLTGTMCQWDFQDPRIPGILPIAKDYVTNRHHF